MVYSLWFKRILFDFIMGLRAALQFIFSPQQDVLAFFPIPLKKLSSDLMPLPPKKRFRHVSGWTLLARAQCLR